MASPFHSLGHIAQVSARLIDDGLHYLLAGMSLGALAYSRRMLRELYDQARRIQQLEEQQDNAEDPDD